MHWALIGNISQWGEVKKKTKDRSRSKAQDSAANPTEATTAPSRGGRGRGGSDGPRGGRGRGTERGRGASRGFRGGSAVNGSKSLNVDKEATDTPGIPASTVVAGDVSSWNSPAVKSDAVDGEMDKPPEATSATPDASWEMVTPPELTPVAVTEAQKPSSKPDGTRSWASIFNKPPPAPARPKNVQAQTSEAPPPEQSFAPDIAPGHIDEPGLPPAVPFEEHTADIPSTPPVSSEQAAGITPSKDELTETNLEQVLDASAPPPTGTAASTVASTQDLRGLPGSATSLHAPQQETVARPPMGGYATSAYKATNTPGRSASFQRRILEQQEAVVMPGNHAVDRAAVQFGSMGLNDTADDLDVDDDREEAETRTQPPQHSPIAPRAALPPAPPQPTIESIPTPRQAPGLPPAAPQAIEQEPSQPAAIEQVAPQQPLQTSYPYNQFNNRYGPQATQPEPSAPVQKAYEPFGQQAQQPHTQQPQYEAYPSHSQAQIQPPAQAQQSHLGNYSSAGNDYSSYYTSDNQRNAYQSYYGNYGQQAQQSQQDAGGSQPRVGSAFGSTGGEQSSQYATSQLQQQPQARYGQAGEAQTSGHSTPNPSLPGQQLPIQAQASHQLPQQQNPGQAGGQHAGYPYGHPYYTSPYYSAYMNQVSHHSYGRDRPMFDDVRRYDDQYLTHNHQFGYGGNQGVYGGGPFGGAGGKQGMYGQPHQGYGMSPQSSYEHHSSSPANVGGFGQQHSVPGRDGTTSGGLGAYGRSGSVQPAENQQPHAGNAQAFGSMPDVFGRPQSGYPGPAQALTQQHSAQHGSNDEAIRGYGDSTKVAGGPSPALGQPGVRPSSATNNMQGQGALPPPQSQNQPGYAGYPSHMNQQMHGQQNSQYGTGLGGLGSHHQSAAQNHQSSGYGAAYGAGFGGSYYGNNNRGGWGGNYGH